MTTSRIGPYRVIRPLGRGGMGVVYRARHEQSGREVALKTVTLPRAALLGSIRREIGALARLSHPGIVRILDDGVDDGRPWYAMELLKGATLRAHAGAIGLASTASEGPWWTASLEGDASAPAGQTVVLERAPAAAPERHPEAPAPRPAEPEAIPDVLGLVRRLCDTLAFVHGEGMVHRDLKPDNVLVRGDGTPVLLDFGLMARFAADRSRDTLEITGGIVGTLAYMAPEQGKGLLPDARADLYALGCILYELLTGAPPFQADAVAALLWKHARVAPEPPSRHAPWIPEALDGLTLRLLAKEPADRFGYAEDVAAALDALGATPPAWPEPPPPSRPYLYRPRFAGRSELRERLGLRVRDEQAAGVVLVAGESGVGKTRLVAELLAEAGNATVLGGEAAEEDRGPLRAFRRPLLHVADICREGGPEATERILGEHGKRLAGLHDAIAALPGQDGPLPPLPPAEARAALLAAVREVLLRLTAVGPVVLALDDLQWADDLSLDLVRLLGEPAPPARLLTLGTYRSEDAAVVTERLPPSGTIEHVLLHRLAPATIASIVGDMLAMAVPPPELVDAIVAASEGNPLYVAEYLRVAVAERWVERDRDGRWVVAPGPRERGLPMPSTLRDLALQRLDRLPAASRDVLDAAAVLGRDVDVDVLEAAAGLDAVAFQEALGLLTRAQLLELTVPAAGPERVAFGHAKLREAALAALPDDVLGRRSLRSAEALAALRAGQAEHLGAIGRHYARAGENERARPYLLSGARAALARYAHDEAERLLRAHLDVTPDATPERIEARQLLAEHVMQFQGRMEEAIEEQSRAREEAERIGDPVLVSTAMRGLGVALHAVGRMEDAGELLEGALARAAGNPTAEAQVHQDLANLHGDRGHMKEAEAHYRSALQAYQAAGDHASEALVLGNLGALLFETGDPEGAEPFLRQAVERHRGLGNRRFEASGLGNLAHVARVRGAMEEAQRLFEAAIAISGEIGDRRRKALFQGNLGCFLAEEGRLGEATDLLRSSLETHRAVGDRRNAGITLSNLAGFLSEQGQGAESQALYREAVAILVEVDSPRFEAIARRDLATTMPEEAAVEAAVQMEAALAAARRAGDPVIEGTILWRFALLDRRAGRFHDAKRRLDDAVAALRTGDPGERVKCLVERARVAADLGEDPGSWLDAAREILRSVDRPPGSLQSAIETAESELRRSS